MHHYRLFSWEHSYFSGKVRAYLRYKQHFGGLGPGFEDILATQPIIQQVLVPATGESNVPQLQAPDGTWIEDSSRIIDYCEAQHAEPRVVPNAKLTPRQALVAHLIELLADEWMVVYAFWERWYYSAGEHARHADYNAQDWGPVFNARGTGAERAAAARWVFENVFNINDPKAATSGPYAWLPSLGMTEATIEAWQTSNDHLLGLLETHFDSHDYVLGGLPCLADFGLLGPLYAHLFRDAVPGFSLRTQFPLVAEWVERTNGTNALNARCYNQPLYEPDASGELTPVPATSDGGALLPDDRVPDSLLPILGVFFDEMWPVLTSSMEKLTAYLQSGAHAPGAPLPGKTFGPSPGFEALQTGEGPLTHEFELCGVRERRTVFPYQVWMLQRVAAVLDGCSASAEGRASVEDLLAAVPNGRSLLELNERLAGCRLRKQNGQLVAA